MRLEKLLRELGKPRERIREVFVRVIDSDGVGMFLSITRVSEHEGVVLIEAEE